MHDPHDRETWELPASETGSQLGAICVHFVFGECLPKDSVGIIRGPFIPPPVPPSMPGG